MKQININDLKLHPTIDQTGTHLYHCSKIIAQYLQPLAINEYTISDTLSFLISLEKNPLDSNKEYTYLLFCTKSIFKKLLNKLRRGCTFLG